MSSKNILVVDSDHNTRVQVRRILEDEGHFITTATNGTDTLSVLVNISWPHLIFISDSLSVMSAGALLKTIKALPQYKETPIIQLKLPSDGLLPDVSATIAKPIGRAELIACVNEL